MLWDPHSEEPDYVGDVQGGPYLRERLIMYGILVSAKRIPPEILWPVWCKAVHNQKAPEDEGGAPCASLPSPFKGKLALLSQMA